jgi:5-formyltetrahydrofolate cyclo-ligase
MDVKKRAIRQALRDQRRRLSAVFVETASAAVYARLCTFPPYQAAAAVVAYVAHENEVSTAALLTAVGSSGRPLCLPSSTDGGRLIRWRPGDPLTAGPGGVLEPSVGEPEPMGTPAVALLPVVAWDERGTRLGRGGGFYDRLFAALTDAVVRVGLAYEFQECPRLPRDPWDISLHYVITERRLVRCGQGEVVPVRSLQKGGMQL